ncbi:Kinesin-like protein KIN12B [Acorus gramineus]|uniref:Kinesin-like protein KIN12B n=1 Tax=Acorus gramineus TaxID=55184 RepID=A0AAV9BKZ6_ACOGR|nr:Kinesin-like protein KIN12B [Acorus gramineus]
MLRDLKLFRRNITKPESSENAPVDAMDVDAPDVHPVSDPDRPPLVTIQEPQRVPRSVPDSRTPLKPPVPMRTPEKPPAQPRNRFGWVHKDGGGGDAVATPRSFRTARVAASSNQSESGSTQNTPTRSVNKPSLNPGGGIATWSGSRPPLNNGPRSAGFTAPSRGLPIHQGLPMVVNTVEVPHFELREDPSFWMDHNVQVVIRVRPLNGMERSLQGYSRCLKQESAQSITWIGHPETRFTFDHVACETVTQEMLFRVAGLPMVENCLSGYNSCMFAYGQTGSGKTHTMLGEIDELEVRPGPDRGMTPRIFEFLFARIKAEEESRRDEKLKYHCKCSFLEIYNEQITDLLDPSSTNLLLREDMKKGVYVENLTEFEVETVNDILRLLIQGSANRRVAATNMNRESSRSHSVFTCIIESRWEKDSTTNLRFARLNLVDLAGSERQKTSGADGERLKEAASINRSLSTLGHVIMVLVDVAHGKQRHIPYRDSRLTFLLQDSLGGNSKTMIIANVSPSVCCTNETLSTLKFAQRAKLIQNNEELSVLKRQNVSRSLSFRTTIFGESESEECDTFASEKLYEIDRKMDEMNGCEELGSIRVSTKQLKYLEKTLAGSLRREKMSDTTIKQLEAEIEQLNRLVRQREEDTRCTKMMLRFREDKIQRMEALLEGVVPVDSYLLEENKAQSEEIQLLRTRVDRNPELIQIFDENPDLDEQTISNRIPKEASYVGICSGNKESDLLRIELERTREELDDCRDKLKSCTEANTILSRDIDDLQSQLKKMKFPCHFSPSAELQKEQCLVSTAFQTPDEILLQKDQEKKSEMGSAEQIMNLQLELDILKVILEEEKVSRVKVEERVIHESNELVRVEESLKQISKHYDDSKNELKDARSVIDALESQQILSIAELEDLRESNNQYVELLRKQEQEICNLKERIASHVEGGEKLSFSPQYPHDQSFKWSEDSPLPARLRRMQASLEKAKKLNTRYHADQASQVHDEQEMDEVRRQVEAETAEVIVCLQEELATLQQQIEESRRNELEAKQSWLLLETELKDQNERLHFLTQDDQRLRDLLLEKDDELRSLTQDWEQLACDITEVLADGHTALEDASDQLDSIVPSSSQRTWVGEQVGRIMRTVSQKNLVIEELQKCLGEAQNIRSDMEWKLRSLRGATLAITEAHQQESSEKEREIQRLSSELSESLSIISGLQDNIKFKEDQIRKSEVSATVAFITVNQLSEINSRNLVELQKTKLQLDDTSTKYLQKHALLQDQISSRSEVENEIQTLKLQLEESEENSENLKLELAREQVRVHAMEQQLEKLEEEESKVEYDLLKTEEKLTEFKLGINILHTSMHQYVEDMEGIDKITSPTKDDITCTERICENQTEIENSQEISHNLSHYVRDVADDCMKTSADGCTCDCPGIIKHTDYSPQRKVKDYILDEKEFECGRTSRSPYNKEMTILLLRKEIETALESLKQVQRQMNKLADEKECIKQSELRSRKGIEVLTTQILKLQSEMIDKEKLIETRTLKLSHDLQMVEGVAKESVACWWKRKEELVSELHDAKLLAELKTIEASGLLNKLEEAQETMREADITVNALVKANEAAKHEMKRYQAIEKSLISERNNLISEVESTQASLNEKEHHHEQLEKRVSQSLAEVNSLVLAVDNIFMEAQDNLSEEVKLIGNDINCLRADLLQATGFTRTWLEEIWSEIVGRDCAVSILHLCHMGILLEAVTGLNAENGFLHNGLSESNAMVAILKEHNFRAKKELEMCSILKGKLLVDVNNSFNRISRKEDEMGNLKAKLISFEKKISDVQVQEELMLESAITALSDQEKLLRENDELRSQLEKSLSLLAHVQRQHEMFRDLMYKDLGLVVDYTVSQSMQSGPQEVIEHFKKLIECQMESIMIGLSTKDLELLVLRSEIKQKAAESNKMVIQTVNAESEIETLNSIVEEMKKGIALLMMDKAVDEQILVEKDAEMVLLRGELEEVSFKLKQNSVSILQLNEDMKAAERNAQLLEEIAGSQLLEVECLRKEVMDDVDLQFKLTKADVDAMGQKLVHQNQVLQHELALLQDLVSRQQTKWVEKNTELNAAIESRQTALNMIKLKSQETEALIRATDDLNGQNIALRNELADVLTDKGKLDAQVQGLQMEVQMLVADLQSKEADLESLSSCMSALDLQNQKFQDDACSQQAFISRLQTELDLKNNEIYDIQQSRSVAVNDLELKRLEGFVEGFGGKIFHSLDEVLSIISFTTTMDEVFQDICEYEERASKFVADYEGLEESVKELMSENLFLQDELKRKDEVLKGMLFDLSLLQESTSNAKDQKDEVNEMLATLESLDEELALKSDELEEAGSHVQALEAELLEKNGIIGDLETELAVKQASLQQISDENVELKAQREEILEMKILLEEEVLEKNKVKERLEEDIVNLTNERVNLDSGILILKEQLEMAHALAEENEAIATEARQISESMKAYAEEKDEEVRLLERSVEELEGTVNVLENKREAEKQRLQREELEMELQAVKLQLVTVREDDGILRQLEESVNELREAKKKIQILQMDVSEKEAEIGQCKTHISELNIHAEAQAIEYKQKFKELEALAKQVKIEPPSTSTCLTSTKSEKNVVKSRGSGSPFKCIGLGLGQQINSEKDEELTAKGRRIEELEAIAASRQKEEKEVAELRKQLNEFVEERQGWLDEINRRHTEMVAVRVASEELRQKYHLLSTENEMLKMDIIKYKKSVMELEDEVKKLSDQHNLQPRIHHHAKIKAWHIYLLVY